MYVIRDLRDKAKNGGGFVEYIWPKPGADDTPKVSYAEMIPGTDMWLGTGVYLDNIESYKQVMASEIGSQVKSNSITMLIIAGIIFAIIITLTLIIVFGLVGGLNTMIDNVRDISEGDGDLTKRVVTSSKDEIGELAGYFNSFIEKLQGIFKIISDNTNLLGSGASSLSQIAASLETNADDTSNRSENVAELITKANAVFDLMQVKEIIAECTAHEQHKQHQKVIDVASQTGVAANPVLFDLESHSEREGGQKQIEQFQTFLPEDFVMFWK